MHLLMSLGETGKCQTYLERSHGPDTGWSKLPLATVIYRREHQQLLFSWSAGWSREEKRL